MSEHSPHVRMTAEDMAAMREYWRFYEPRRAAIVERARAAILRSGEWSRLSPERITENEDASHALQAAAILEDRWEPYLASLRAQGEQYAIAGLSYSAWFDLIGTYRDITRDHLAVHLREDMERNTTAVFEIARGMNRFLDIVVERIGDSYLSTSKRLAAQSEERYRAMFDKSPVPMWIFERETLQILDVNEASVRQYGYSRDEFLAMTLADVRPPEDVVAMRTDVQRADGFAESKIWRHRKKDGSLIHVEIRGNDFVIDGKNVRLVSMHDVTERVRAEEALKKTEEQLRHAQKMEAIGRLAGGVAHDFNNVLMVVQTLSCMLEESIDPTDSRHQDAAEIRRASERGAAITRQLLAVSRHSIVAPRSVDLDELVEGFVPMLRRLVGPGVTVVTHRASLPKVIADPGQLEQVMMNLAVNARDAMPDGGRLTIETRTLEIDAEAAATRGVAAGRFVELAVTDTGTGMDAETRRRIFDPFYTTKEAGKGTGLGLSIVHGIVSQAGGMISVYSELGHGSTFRVQLPVGDGVVAPPDREQVTAPRTLPSLNVLVVDDQYEVRAVTVRILQEAGCKVVEAATADQARKLCVSHEDPIDLAVLDVVLPDGRGDELIHQLRDLRPSMKFVQVSGYPAGALTPNGAAPPDLLAKPFTPTELRAAIARACNLTSDSAALTSVTPSGKSRRRALVADDDREMRRVVVRILSKSGYEVVDVDSGFKAITALESAPFDVVVSDVQMPDGGGLDLLRAVRRVDLDVPVILMTGEPSLNAASAAVEYGAFRYLTKPLDVDSFVKTVDHAARAHALARLRREAFNVSGAHGGVADRAGLEVRFEQALAGMWMAFQPIVHANNGVLFGVEALMRSNEPSLPNPPALLDAATSLGRLPLIGRRVRTLSAAAFADRADDITLFVNLHPEDLHDVSLVDDAAALSKLAPRVILEVTERASLDSSAAMSERIARLRRLGFRLAVDDIGAGYSGLTSFTELTPEIVKIDMSLVRDVHKSALKQRTIAALCRLCHEIGTLVVGEGVETHEEREVLVGLGCDLLQGYLIGRPKRELP